MVISSYSTARICRSYISVALQRAATLKRANRSATSNHSINVSQTEATSCHVPYARLGSLAGIRAIPLRAVGALALIRRGTDHA